MAPLTRAIRIRKRALDLSREVSACAGLAVQETIFEKLGWSLGQSLFFHNRHRMPFSDVRFSSAAFHGDWSVQMGVYFGARQNLRRFRRPLGIM